MMNKKVLLIYNPHSGRATIAKNLDVILQKFCQGGYECTVYPMMNGIGAEEILDQRGADGFDLVVCCGGDGTLHHAMNGLLRRPNPPVLGYLPAGSTNDFAASLGLPKTVEAAAEAIVNGSPRTLDVGDFGGELFNYVAAFGAFSAVSYSTTQSSKNSMGHLAYIVEGLKRLPIGQHYPAKVEINGQVLDGDYIFGAVCNTNFIGGFSMEGMVDTQLDDGEFEVLLIKAPTSVLEVNTLVAKLLVRDFDNDYLISMHSNRVKFTFETPTAWTLDGEFGGELQEVEIAVRPGALRLQL